MPLPSFPRNEPARTWLVACALFALALALRLPGIGFLLPHLPEPDGVKFIGQIAAVRSGDPAIEPTINLRSYPTLVPRVAALFEGASKVLGPTDELAEHLDAAAHDYRMLRLASAVLSALLAPFVFLLARRFLALPFASLAGLLAASSALHLWFSVQARPHGAAASCVALALLAAVELRARNRPIDCVLAGASLGLAIGALQSSVALGFAFLAALVLRDARGARHRLAPLALGGAALACAWLFLHPFHFVPVPAGEAADMQLEGDTLNFGGHTIILSLFDGRGFPVVARELWLYDPWICALSALAAIAFALLAWRKGLGAPSSRGRDVLVLLAHALPYLIAIGLYRRTYQRFLLPLLPHLCLVIAWSAQILVERLARARPSHVLAAAAVALVASPQLVLALGIARARLAPDTASVVAAWVTTNVAPKARIAFPPAMELPLASTQAALDANAAWMDSPWRPWWRYQHARGAANLPEPKFELVQMPLGSDEARQAAVRDPAAFVRALEADYAVVEVWTDRGFPVLRRMREACAELGELVLRVGPEGEGDAASEDLPLYYVDDEYKRHRAWTWRALTAGRFGPTFEVYRLRR